MPYQPPSKKKAQKVLFNKISEAVGPDDNMGDLTTAEQPESLPQQQKLSPHVNTAGKEPEPKLEEKKAQYYALPAAEMYPLDAYGHVVKAASYFDEWGVRMEPELRREYCSNLVKRASALGIKVSPAIRKYGSATYAPAAELFIAIDGRKNILSDENDRALLDKLAEALPTMSPELFATALSEFDKASGIDHLYGSAIPDPYYSTFGTKTAEDDSPKGSIVVGNDYMTEAQLKRFAAMESGSIKDRFGNDFVDEFRKDPVGIFNSLPVDQKKYIMRLATDNMPSDTHFGL